MLTPQTIANKTFRRTLFGYDLEQVDDFLDEIILRLQQMEQERKEMMETIDGWRTQAGQPGESAPTGGGDHRAHQPPHPPERSRRPWEQIGRGARCPPLPGRRWKNWGLPRWTLCM